MQKKLAWLRLQKVHVDDLGWYSITLLTSLLTYPELRFTMIRNWIEYFQLLNTIVEQLWKTIELCPWASRSYLQSQNESGFITVQKVDGRTFLSNPTYITG